MTFNATVYWKLKCTMCKNSIHCTVRDCSFMLCGDSWICRDLTVSVFIATRGRKNKASSSCGFVGVLSLLSCIRQQHREIGLSRALGIENRVMTSSTFRKWGWNLPYVITCKKGNSFKIKKWFIQEFTWSPVSVYCKV